MSASSLCPGTSPEIRQYFFLLRARDRQGLVVDIAYAVSACHKNVAERVAQNDFVRRTGLRPAHMIYRPAAVRQTGEQVEMVVPASADDALYRTILSPSLTAMGPPPGTVCSAAPAPGIARPAVPGKSASSPGRKEASERLPELDFPDYSPAGGTAGADRARPESQKGAAADTAQAAHTRPDRQEGAATNCTLQWHDVREQAHPGRGEDQTALLCVKRPVSGRIVLAALARWNGRHWVCRGKRIRHVAYWAHRPALPEELG